MPSPYNWGLFQDLWSDSKLRPAIGGIASPDNTDQLILDFAWAAELLHLAETAWEHRPIPRLECEEIQKAVAEMEGALERLRKLGSDQFVTGHDRDRGFNSIASEVHGTSARLVGKIRSYLSTDTADLISLSQSARAAVAELAATQDQYTTMIDRLQTLAGESAAGTLAGYYKSEAEKQRKNANAYLIALGVALAALGGVAAWAFLLYPPHIAAADPAGTQAVEFVRSALGRLTVVSVFAYGISFASRNYRVSKHLETLNQSRCNALMTAKLFMESVESEARTIIVSELVRAIFGSGDSGYIDGGTDTTVIESPAGMVTALLASKSAQ